MRKLFEYGGIIAGFILIAFGVASIALSANGRTTVRDSVSAEAIVGSPDMTPSAIKEEAAAAGLKNVDLPTCSVAGKAIDSGSRARCFAQYMRIHALEATGGLTYAQMGRYLDENGKQTNDSAAAAKDDNGKPVENGARNIWINETALATALNVSYMAEQLALFGLVVGVAFLLAGGGFLILAVGGALGIPLLGKKKTAAPSGVPQPTL
jgi:hypothetical protein